MSGSERIISRKDGYIAASGHATVLQLLDHFTQVVKDDPQIGYASLVLVPHGEKPPLGGYAGDIELEARAVRATQSAYGAMQERIINRVLPPRPANSPANYAVYNTAAGSVSFDFLIWLIDAEMQRIAEGEPPPLKVHFWHGRDGQNAGNFNPERARMFENVMRPALQLIGAVEHEDGIHGRDYHNRHGRMIAENARAGQKVPIFKAPVWARKEWDKNRIIKPGYVTITLREAEHWPHRNSNLDAWARFTDDLVADGQQVIVIRDTAKADETFPRWGNGVWTESRAAIDICYRMAVYEQAKANLFVANGPCILAAFSDRPWLTFTPIEPDDSPYRANTAAFWRIHNGVDVGEQYPWSRPDQRIVWERDDYENIVRAWESLSGALRGFG